MLNKSLFIQPASGFVPFSGAGTAELDAPARAVTVEFATDWSAGVEARPSWEAPAGAGVRRVEMVILASVCGYFTFGLGGLLGLY